MLPWPGAVLLLSDAWLYHPQYAMGGPIGLRGGQAAPGYADSISAHLIGIAPKYDGVPIQPAKERSLAGWKDGYFS